MAAIRQGVVEEPKLHKELRKRGYRIVAVDDGYYGHCGTAVDRCIGGGDRTSDHRYEDMRLLGRTPSFRALDVLDMKLNLFDPPLNLCDVHTSVNTFRVVLACLDGTGPELLENRLFAVHYPYWPSGGHVREWRLK